MTHSCHDTVTVIVTDDSVWMRMTVPPCQQGFLLAEVRHRLWFRSSLEAAGGSLEDELAECLMQSSGMAASKAKLIPALMRLGRKGSGGGKGLIMQPNAPLRPRPCAPESKVASLLVNVSMTRLRRSMTAAMQRVGSSPSTPGGSKGVHPHFQRQPRNEEGGTGQEAVRGSGVGNFWDLIQSQEGSSEGWVASSSSIPLLGPRVGGGRVLTSPPSAGGSGRGGLHGALQTREAAAVSSPHHIDSLSSFMLQIGAGHSQQPGGTRPLHQQKLQEGGPGSNSDLDGPTDPGPDSEGLEDPEADEILAISDLVHYGGYIWVGLNPSGWVGAVGAVQKPGSQTIPTHSLLPLMPPIGCGSVLLRGGGLLSRLSLRCRPLPVSPKGPRSFPG